MSRFLQLRLLWRRAASNPGFTLVALATLAVGIGANVAIFTVVNAVLLRPLPIPDSERLVMLRHAAPGLTQLDELPMSDALYFLYAEESRTLDGVAVFRDLQASFTGPENPQRVQASRVTASFFDVVRTPPRIGRGFTSEDDRPGAAPVAVLADGLWRTRAWLGSRMMRLVSANDAGGSDPRRAAISTARSTTASGGASSSTRPLSTASAGVHVRPR